VSLGFNFRGQYLTGSVLIRLQAGHVVSASGDGTMILWDIETGNRVRTFVGHDKGLACVEFKVCFEAFYPQLY
jgi:WD40 repeat protein